jgi:hypothetical protein
MTIKYTKCAQNGSKIDQMAIKCVYIFQCKTHQNLPKLGFLVWKYTIWQPWIADKDRCDHSSYVQQNCCVTSMPQWLEPISLDTRIVKCRSVLACMYVCMCDLACLCISRPKCYKIKVSPNKMLDFGSIKIGTRMNYGANPTTLSNNASAVNFLQCHGQPRAFRRNIFVCLEKHYSLLQRYYLIVYACVQ